MLPPPTVLILLDLSSAFDTVNYVVLFDHLQTRFFFSGKVLSWLRSYLLGRQQVVNIDGDQSDSTAVRWGVPQGSVLGPLLFNLYSMSPIEVSSLPTYFLYYYMRMICNSI